MVKSSSISTRRTAFRAACQMSASEIPCFRAGLPMRTFSTYPAAQVQTMHLVNDDLNKVAAIVETQASGLKNPPLTVTQLLDGFEELGLTRSVALLRSAFA